MLSRLYLDQPTKAFLPGRPRPRHPCCEGNLTQVSVDDPFITRQHAINAARQSEQVRRAFGELLRRSRHAAGLSMARIEQLTGISETELADIESGRTDPSLETVVALAKVLRRDVAGMLSAEP